MLGIFSIIDATVLRYPLLFFILFMGYNIMLYKKIELDHIVGTGKKVNLKKRVQRFNDLGFRSVDL